MHCALVIVNSQYGHYEEWQNIIINIINVVGQYKPSVYRKCVRCKLYMHRRHYTTLQHCLVQCNIKFLCSWKQNVSSMFWLLDVQINVYKRDTKYLNVSTDIPHRTIRINTATTSFFESFRRNLKHCIRRVYKSYNPKLKVFSFTNIKHFPCWYTCLYINTSGIGKTINCIWKHDARRAECFHTISSFPNFHECWYNYMSIRKKCFIFFYNIAMSKARRIRKISVFTSGGKFGNW
jgi:hypothetical protein